MPWYRQYRPTTLSGLHLVTVRAALEQLLTANQFPHALLLVGPKGAGKTSAARIIAALLNDPANADVVKAKLLGQKDVPAARFKDPNLQEPVIQRIFAGNSLVVQELDAASNRGIDDIRLLKERAYLGPAEGLVTVFILDEVHMLTAEAFNALLKLLEEPPANVVFLLATTDPQKIPDTIVSRCMMIRFSKASSAELQSAVDAILTDQKLSVEPAALEAVLRAADGSFRDAVKYLEQVSAGKDKVSLADVEATLALSSHQEVLDFVAAIIQKEELQLVEVVESLRQAGRSSQVFHKTLVELLAAQLLLSAQGKEALYSLRICQYLLAHFNDKTLTQLEVLPFLGLELKALELILKAKERGTSATGKPVAAPQAVVHQSSAVQVSSSVETSQKPVPDMRIVAAAEVVHQSSPTTSFSSLEAGDLALITERWEQILLAVKERNSSIEALLRSARVRTDLNRVQIEVYYQFHQEQLQQPKFRAMLDGAFQAILGVVPPVEFVLADSARPGAGMSNVSGQVDAPDQLIQLAKELLV